MAAEGKAFYTEASDHFGCAVGAYTHGAELPDPQAKELAGLITTMVNLSYLEQHEAASIPLKRSSLRSLLSPGAEPNRSRSGPGVGRCKEAYAAQ